MNYLKSAHSLIFKMLKSAEKCWKNPKKIYSLWSYPWRWIFQHFPEMCQFTYDPRAFLSSAFFSNTFFVSKPLLSWSCFAFSVCWTTVSHHGCWAEGFSLSLSLSCRRRRVCVAQERKWEPRVISGRTRRWCFLVSHAGRPDDGRGLQLKRCQGRIRSRIRTELVTGGYVLLVTQSLMVFSGLFSFSRWGVGGGGADFLPV